MARGGSRSGLHHDRLQPGRDALGIALRSSIERALLRPFRAYTASCLRLAAPDDSRSLRRNRKGIAAFRQIWAPIIQSAREYSERWALGIDWEHPHAGCSPLGHLSQVPEEFDFPN